MFCRCLVCRFPKRHDVVVLDFTLHSGWASLSLGVHLITVISLVLVASIVLWILRCNFRKSLSSTQPVKNSVNSSSNVSELIEMDKNNLDRVTLHKQLMNTETEDLHAAQESVKPAVDELYTWILRTYLPTRFPQSFKITKDSKSLHSPASGDISPLKSPELPIDALRTLGSTVEDDLFFLLPSLDRDGYTLHGFVICFPGGFDTRKMHSAI